MSIVAVKKQPIYQSNDHVLIHILSYLPYQDVLKTCALVNKTWYWFTQHRLLWFSYIKQTVGYEITEYQSAQDYKWPRFFKELVNGPWKWRRAVSFFNVYDEHFRAIIMGDKKVGKTGFLFRASKIRFEGEEALKRGVSKYEMSYKTTRMMDMRSGRTVKLQIYDTNMEDMATYVKTCNSYLSLCHIVILTFSVLRKPSFFNAIQKWLYLVKKRNSDHYIIFLVGTNADKQSKRAVSYEEASRVAKENGMLYFEVSNLEKNDFKFHAIVQTMVHATYRKVIDKKAPFDRVNSLVTTLERDEHLDLIRKKQVMIIPNPESIDLSPYSFESDGEKEQKKDLDEIRLQEYIKQLRQDEMDDEDVKENFLKSPRPRYVQESSATQEDIEEMQIQRPEPTPLPEDGETTPSEVKKEDIKQEQPEKVESLGDDNDMEAFDDDDDDLDLSEWNESMAYDHFDDDGLLCLNSTLPNEEDPEEGPEFWDRYIEENEMIDETQRKIDDILGYKRLIIEKLIKAAEFDFSEKNTSFDKQILQFAKKLRDDKEMNEKLTSEEKTTLKNFVRVAYDFITKNQHLKNEFPDKVRELETSVNRVVTDAFKRHSD